MLLVVARLTSAACALIQVPIALAYLGTEAFGLWMALAGALGVLAILDGGIGFALQNRMARAIASGRAAEAGVLIRMGVRRLIVIATAMLLIGIPLAWALPWADWLQVRNGALRAQTAPAVAVVVFVASITLPLSLTARIATARQETWRIGLWSMIASIVSLAVLLWAVYAGWTLAGFLAATGMVPLVLHIGLATHLISFKRSESTTPPLQIETRGLARESALFFMPQIGAAFIGTFLPTLVAFFAGASAVAAFSVLQRLFGLVLQLQMLGLQPTWPAYTHAAERADFCAARRILRGSLFASAATCVVLLSLVPMTPSILQLWLGHEVPTIEPALLWAIVAWHVLQVFGQPLAMLLNGTGRIAAMAIAGWIMILLGVGLSAWLGPLAGATGVVVAMIIPYAVLNLPVACLEARRALGSIGAVAPAR